MTAFDVQTPSPTTVKEAVKLVYEGIPNSGKVISRTGQNERGMSEIVDYARITRNRLMAQQAIEQTDNDRLRDSDDSLTDNSITDPVRDKLYTFPSTSSRGRVRRAKTYVVKVKDKEGKIYRLTVRTALNSDRAQEVIEAIMDITSTGNRSRQKRGKI